VIASDTVHLRKYQSNVIPAQAGIQWGNRTQHRLDSRLRGNDDSLDYSVVERFFPN
jgi:hypothetical protein